MQTVKFNTIVGCIYYFIFNLKYAIFQKPVEINYFKFASIYNVTTNADSVTYDILVIFNTLCTSILFSYFSKS